LNARTREHPGSGGERENATAGSQCVDGDSSQSAAAPPEAGGAAISEAVLYRLMAWLSPAYPVGAFSYSSGLEWAVEAGDVKNADTLAAWLAVVVGEGGGFCDAVLFAHAHCAATARDEEALRSVAELAAAFAPSKERHLETSAQGGAFLEVTRPAWPCAALDFLAQTWPGPYAYPIAVATAAAGHGIEVAGHWDVTDSWRLTASYSWFDLDASPASAAWTGSPEQQFQVRSALNLPFNTEFNAALYYVDQIHPPYGLGSLTVQSYFRLDLGLVWHASKSLDVGIWGQNLLDDRHPEFTSFKTPLITEIPRGVLAKVVFRF